MRTNLPVTAVEYTFPPEQTLVSVTDVKGRITYCNPAFVTVSGFSREELMGQPHNIVRHPDMPREAFRDMWETIEAGMPWTALVKNRRKDGSFYWVRANATPMRDGPRIVGYLSVRTVPSRDEVQAATALYARMKSEADSGRVTLALHRGQLQRRDLPGRLLRALTPGLRGRMIALQAACIAPAAAAAAWLPGWAALGLGALAAVAGGALAAMALTRPLRAVVNDANTLASGDLTHRIATGAAGEVGQLQQALTQLAVNLRTVVSDVQGEIVQVAGAATEIAAGNQDLSARTESQASSLQQTAASMEQIHGTVQQSAMSAQEGARLAQEMSGLAERSHDAIRAAAQTMERITESAQRMSEIIRTIEGVAFQTNILALNAAVEAARAGESGRGFAVVASEVRALAHRTTEAAREIKQLIQESGERVSVGNEQSTQARDRMAVAMQSIERVGTLLAEIATATREQQVGIGQVNEAVTHLDSVTQQNAAMVEEMAASSQSLNGQVDAVMGALRLFRLSGAQAGPAMADAVQLRRAAKAAAPSSPPSAPRKAAAPAPAAEARTEDAWETF